MKSRARSLERARSPGAGSRGASSSWSLVSVAQNHPAATLGQRRGDRKPLTWNLLGRLRGLLLAGAFLPSSIRPPRTALTGPPSHPLPRPARSRSRRAGPSAIFDLPSRKSRILSSRIMPMRMSRFCFSRYSAFTFATFLPVSAASSCEALLDVLFGDLELLLAGDRGHQEPRADLLLGVRVDAVVERSGPSRWVNALTHPARLARDLDLHHPALLLDERRRHVDGVRRR